MVTWGANTVHNIGSSPATPAFGASAPAPGGFSFSSSQPSGIFGSSAPAPASGGIFGNPAPAPSGGLFGFSAPAPSGGFFGAQAPAPFGTTTSAGLFGSPAPAPFGTTTSGGLFGSPAPAPGGGLFGSSIFGSNPAQQQQHQHQQPQIPAQAALQAHMDASARNEESRVIRRMQKIHQAYSGMTTADAVSHCFSTVLYNPVSLQQRQLQAAHASMMLADGSSGQLFAPPKPPQISEADWNVACVRNLDSQNFMPEAVVGAECLQARAVLHQEQANTIAKHLATIQDAAAQLQLRHADVARQLDATKQKHQKQLARLLKVMKHVEVARCFNLPLQTAEMEAQSRMLELKRNVIDGTLGRTVSFLANPQLLVSTSAIAMEGASQVSHEQQQQWMKLMKEHRNTIAQMTALIQTEQRDLQLIKDRVVSSDMVPVRSARIESA